MYGKNKHTLANSTANAYFLRFTSCLKSIITHFPSCRIHPPRDAGSAVGTHTGLRRAAEAEQLGRLARPVPVRGRAEAARSEQGLRGGQEGPGRAEADEHDLLQNKITYTVTGGLRL